MRDPTQKKKQNKTTYINQKIRVYVQNGKKLENNQANKETKQLIM